MAPFPYRKYSKEQLLLEYYKLRDKILSTPKTKNISYSKIGLSCSNNFFQRQRVKVSYGHKQSLHQAWNDPKERKKVLDYHKTHNKDLFGILIFFYAGASQFPPFVAGMVYKYFGATSVADFYGGWGNRLLSALSLGIDYTGVDSNTSLESSYSKMINFYPSESKGSFYFMKAEEFIKGDGFRNLKFDLFFSSPPFFKKYGNIVEEYHNTESNYSLFLNESLIPVMKACLNRRVWVCLYIPENMYLDLSKVFGKYNLLLTFSSPHKVYRDGGFPHLIYCWKN